MKKLNIIFAILICFLFVSLGLLANNVWLKVHYTRTTGPEFVVESDKSILKNKYGAKSDVDYSMILSDIQTDTENGYLDSKIYFLFGTFSGFKCDTQPCEIKYIQLRNCFLIPVWPLDLIIILCSIMGAIFSLMLLKKFLILKNQRFLKRRKDQ